MGAAATTADIQDSAPGLRVFAAGRIDAAKGFAAWLNETTDEALRCMQIRIAGDGPDLPALRSKHEARGVEFLGWCGSAQVMAQIRVADVCIVPSVWDEPCATTVLEALALGKTVFALSRGGTPELARYGEPDQLRLFETSADLARATTHHVPATWVVHERAAVQARLPELLAVYRDRNEP
jgi:glycosyltransferase involved in cell wall biosynthesis